MRTKRISRQLKKVFGDDTVESAILTFAPGGEQASAVKLVGEIQELVEKFPEFLDSVEETYQELDERATIAQRSMEVSAAELTEANSRLFRLNQTFDAMVNSLGQGFVLFGPDGVCLDVYTKACEDLLENVPKGMKVSELLRVPSDKLEGFTGWLEILFQDTMEFEEFARLGPKIFDHAKGKKVSIEYKPVRGSEGKIDFIMLIATDFTKEFEAEERAREMKAQANLVTSILKNRDRFTQFVQQFRTLVEKCRALLDKKDLSDEALLDIRRNLHAMKGASGTFGMLAVQTKVHGIETEIAKRETPGYFKEYLLKEIPVLLGLFERVLAENADVIGSLPKTNEPQREVSLAQLMEIERMLADQSCSPQTVRERLVKEVIAVPCEDVFSHYDVVVQETASRLGKQVRKIAVSGGDIRIVPERYPSFFTNLPHVFRNIVDHGIESVDERLASGKDADGRVEVAVKVEKGNLLHIRIADDGRGIDVERVKKKLRDMGKAELADKGSRAQVIDAIFAPGFSTAQAVTEISGRGIGLEAVRNSVEEFGGTITVDTDPGKGTFFEIHLPLPKEGKW